MDAKQEHIKTVVDLLRSYADAIESGRMDALDIGMEREVIKCGAVWPASQTFGNIRHMALPLETITLRIVTDPEKMKRIEEAAQWKKES